MRQLTLKPQATSHPARRRRPRLERMSRVVAGVLALTGLAVAATDSAQAQPKRIDPRAPGVVTGLPELGRMYGLVNGSGAENFGGSYIGGGDGITALGDISGDGINDFAVWHRRTDTAGAPQELLIYHGVRGGLPASTSGQRVRVSEAPSYITLLGSGDFDGDGFGDLVLAVEIKDDTTAGNVPGGKPVARLVIFWNDGYGYYSLSDTTRLSCESEMWLGIQNGLGKDFDGDGTDDLMVRAYAGFSQGEVVAQPQLRIYRGHRGGRWGRGGLSRRADWRMWNIPPTKQIRILDQDCDGNPDVVFIDNETSSLGSVGVLYGRKGALPDTTELEVVDLTVANGHYALFSDVTGDGSYDLLVNCGGAERIRIYAGRPAQRLLEQYGSGYEGPSDGHGWWSRPWAEVLSPDQLHEDGWGGSGGAPLYDMGDANLDGADEIWTASWPLIIGYSGGRGIDSLIDVVIHFPGTDIMSVARLGDIDGSGEPTVAIGYNNYPNDNGFPGAIVFLKPDQSVPTWTPHPRLLPHLPGEFCGATSAAVEVPARTCANALAIRVIPNPAAETLRVEWTAAEDARAARLELVDENGNVVLDQPVSATAGLATVDTTPIPAGTYFLRMVFDDTTTHATTVRIR